MRMERLIAYNPKRGVVQLFSSDLDAEEQAAEALGTVPQLSPKRISANSFHINSAFLCT
jgi:hypothetical protein